MTTFQAYVAALVVMLAIIGGGIGFFFLMVMWPIIILAVVGLGFVVVLVAMFAALFFHFRGRRV